jgi:O-antigen ligase
LYKSKRKILFILTFILVASGAIVALIGTLKIGPLANVLYKGSVTSRGDFFRAAVNSGNSNFFNGTGFDSFGDYFLLYRDDVAGNRPNGEFTDSAHNYFLDLYATQGFFGLAFYVLLTLMTLYSFTKIIQTKDFEISSAVLFASWVAVQVQSLVSPTNFLFSILIYSISGIVIGSASNIELNSRIRLNNFSVAIGCFLALLITIPPISRENLILKANQQSSPEKFISSLDKFPKSTVSYSRAINLFAQAGLENQALYVSKEAINFNVRTPAAHLIIFTSLQTSREEKLLAYKTLLELDPKNPKLYGLEP